MPSRPSSPSSQSSAQRLSKDDRYSGAVLVQLHPAGKQTIAGMVAKGWIEMQMDANGGARFASRLMAKRP